MGRTVIALFLFSLAANAQQAETGVAIASFDAGGIFGVGAHGSVGGSLAAPISRYLVPFVDFSYSPLTSYAYTYGADGTGKGLYRSYLLDANGGLKIRFTSKRDWVPYVGLGAGLLHFTSNDYTSGFGATATTNQSRNEFAGNASVGALYYITQHVGFSIEAKGYAARYNRFVRATAGIFYQFP
jgi:outer membrane protein W